MRIEGEEHHLVREAGYLFLLSRIGEHLDARGLPRVHGLGLAGSRRGLVLLLPAGGGKSTLCLRALREGVGLLSEDSPLIDRNGTASLESVPPRAAVGPLLRESVIGVGLYQGVEFVLRRGPSDIAGKLGVAVVRSACCAAALAHARVWRLTLGRDSAANWNALRPLLV